MLYIGTQFSLSMLPSAAFVTVRVSEVSGVQGFVRAFRPDNYVSLVTDPVVAHEYEIALNAPIIANPDAPTPALARGDGLLVRDEYRTMAGAFVRWLLVTLD